VVTSGVVLGGSSGIGAAVVDTMAKRGCQVISASRRGTAVDRPGVSAMSCDVRDAAGIAEVFARAAEAGGLDWVVNAAGVGFYAPVEERFAEQWHDILDTNVFGMLQVLSQLRALAVPVRQFVQIGSLAGTRPSRTPGNDVYAAAKTAGAQLLARHRLELRAAGVNTKVTLITPGYVGGTDFGRNFFDSAPELNQPIFDQFTPLSALDVARMVEYALDQPEHVELSEIVVRPVDQPD
jgi:NADP-dependent 3-hydroxy acid dehydrogenase YdfG